MGEEEGVMGEEGLAFLLWRISYYSNENNL